MRRHGNLYEKITSIENIRLAYAKTRKGKTWQRQVKTFDLNVEENLRTIQQLLINKTFKTSVYHTKIVHEPKERVIFIVPFSPDRIVHHALMNVLESIYKAMFIHDSYACIDGKGRKFAFDISQGGADIPHELDHVVFADIDHMEALRIAGKNLPRHRLPYGTGPSYDKKAGAGHDLAQVGFICVDIRFKKRLGSSDELEYLIHADSFLF